LRAALAAWVLAGGLGSIAAIVAACRVPNTDHCLHQAIDANAWCVDHEEGRDFCSPCEAEHHGCVNEEPTEDECPEYSAPAPAETGSDTGDVTGTGTDTGTDTDTG
jgi:hypothetical protein